MAKRKILIIEDDPVQRRLLSVPLRAKDYETAFATDATTATTVARREKPDLILLDLLMPGGHGMAIIDRFRNLADLGHVPIIVITGSDAQKYREQALKAGAAAFFEKPADPAQLLAAIRSALGEGD